MLNDLIDAEEYKSIIGLRYPTLFIDKIVLTGTQESPRAEVDCFCLFEIPVAFSESDFSDAIAALPIDFYIGTSVGDFYQAFNNTEDKITYQNPFAMMVNENYGDYITTISDFFDDADIQEVYNSSGKRFILFSKTITIPLMAGFITNDEYLNIICFSYERNMFNDISNNKTRKIYGYSHRGEQVSIFNDKTIDLDLLKFKRSRVSYENIAKLGSLNKDDKIIYIDSEDLEYHGDVLYSLSNTYHKADDSTRGSIYNNVKSIVNTFMDGRSNAPRAKTLANSLLTILEEDKAKTKLLFNLDKQNRSIPVKSTALPVGQLFKKVDQFITAANSSLLSIEEVTKRVVGNSKIVDNLTSTNNFVSSPGFSSRMLPDSRFIYRPLTTRKAILVAEDYLKLNDPDGDSPTVLADSVVIENNSLFFIDHEKITDLKTKISQFIDVYSLSLLLGGKATIRNFFKRNRLSVSRGTVVDINSGVAGSMSLVFKDLIQDGDFQFDLSDSIITNAMPALEMTTSDSTSDILFPCFAVVSNVIDGNLGGVEGTFQNFIKFSYLAERHWDLPSVSSNPLFFQESGYSLCAYEIVDLHNSDDVLSGNEPIQFYLIEYECTDNTAKLYEEYIRKPFKEAIDSFEVYLNYAQDFCSTNENNSFNDFFIKAMDEKYSNDSKPWELASFFYVYMSSLLDVSWNEEKTERVRDRIIDIDACNKEIKLRIAEISPSSGYLDQIERMHVLLSNLYNNYFANSSTSLVGEQTDIYSFSADSEEPLLAETELVTLSSRYLLPTEVKPTAELLLPEEEENEASDDPPTAGGGGGTGGGTGGTYAGPRLIDDLAKELEEYSGEKDITSDFESENDQYGF